MDSPSPSHLRTPKRMRTPKRRGSHRNGTPKTPKTPRTPRTQRYKFSTTGTEVSPITTLEADAALQIFPQILRAQIKRYLEDNRDRGDGIELTFAKNGNTKLTVSADGFPAYFVIPETDQKLDAGRYRYGLDKGSPLVVVVQQKKDSTISFNNGQPAIVLYHGKHSSIEGPHKVSKWVVWDNGVLRTDVMVWRIAEGARTAFKEEDEEEQELEDAPSEMSIDDIVRPSTPEFGATECKQEDAAMSSGKDNLQGDQPMEPSVVTSNREAVSNSQHIASNNHMPLVSTSYFPIDPRLLPHNMLNDHSQHGNASNTSQSQSAIPYTWPRMALSAFQTNFPRRILPVNQQSLHPQAAAPRADHYNCLCGGGIMTQRMAQMAEATDRILTRGYNCVVKFQFRSLHGWQPKETKTLEDCRTMSSLFAYARLFRTMPVQHHVVAIHFLNSETNHVPLYMVLNDVSHWQSLMFIVEEQIVLKEMKARGIVNDIENLELLVIDGGY